MNLTPLLGGVPGALLTQQSTGVVPLPTMAVVSDRMCMAFNLACFSLCDLDKNLTSVVPCSGHRTTTKITHTHMCHSAS